MTRRQLFYAGIQLQHEQAALAGVITNQAALDYVARLPRDIKPWPMKLAEAPSPAYVAPCPHPPIRFEVLPPQPQSTNETSPPADDGSDGLECSATPLTPTGLIKGKNGQVYNSCDLD